jgi:hypothetical protein
MEQIEHTDGRGRKYKAFREGENVLIIGPPEDLVDELELPESFATNLHNVLYRRGIFSFQDAAKNMNNLIGALQEAYRLDAQKLTAAFFEHEGASNGGRNE